MTRTNNQPNLTIQVSLQLFNEIVLGLRKSIAMYKLLHAHAAGQTDLTEDQLANVVTGLAEEATDTLVRAGVYRGPSPGEAHGRAAPVSEEALCGG